MKLRVLVTASLVLLAACGGSEKSTSEVSTQDSTRTKNAALTPTTNPAATNIQTTPTNKTCAQGGLCNVGDTGPGGGIVFYAEATPQPWGQFIEVSQTTLDPRFDTMWCDGATTIAFPGDALIGNGRMATEFYAKYCKLGVLRNVTALVQGGYDDWYLPTLPEAKQLFKNRDITKIEGQWHLTTSVSSHAGKIEPYAFNMVEGASMPVNPLAGYAARAVRAFGPKAASCANGDAPCKVGDTGPGGGIVFYVAPAPQPWGQYYEVFATTLDPRFDTMWCDVAPTADPVPPMLDPDEFFAASFFRGKACQKGALRLVTTIVSNGRNDWYLPSLAQMKQMYEQRSIVKIEGQWHYTTDIGTLDGKPAPIAFYFVDGQTKAMNHLAGFAVRAVRAFGPKVDKATVTTTATPATTIAPATTVAATIAPTTTVRTTTTAAKPTSCATGGACKIGDTGPGGGLVFYVSTTPQSWGQYLEAPTKNLAPNQLWCDNLSTDIAGAQGTAHGTGKQNTIDMDAACKSGAGQSAADFNLGGKDDWYLPSKIELYSMFEQRKLLNMSGYYFSSTEAGAQYAWDQYMEDGTPYKQGKNNGRNVRPIRAFGPTATSSSSNSPLTTVAPAVTVTPTSAPKTVATTATTIAKPAQPAKQSKQSKQTPTTIKK